MDARICAYSRKVGTIQSSKRIRGFSERPQQFSVLLSKTCTVVAKGTQLTVQAASRKAIFNQSLVDELASVPGRVVCVRRGTQA